MQRRYATAPASLECAVHMNTFVMLSQQFGTFELPSSVALTMTITVDGCPLDSRYYNHTYEYVCLLNCLPCMHFLFIISPYFHIQSTRSTWNDCVVVFSALVVVFDCAFLCLISYVAIPEIRIVQQKTSREKCSNDVDLTLHTQCSRHISGFSLYTFLTTRTHYSNLLTASKCMLIRNSQQENHFTKAQATINLLPTCVWAHCSVWRLECVECTDDSRLYLRQCALITCSLFSQHLHNYNQTSNIDWKQNKSS